MIKSYYNDSFNTIYKGDALVIMDKLIKDNIKVDLIVTDPPYLIENTKAGGNSKFAKSIQHVNDELENGVLNKGVNNIILEKFLLLQDKINIYGVIIN